MAAQFDAPKAGCRVLDSNNTEPKQKNVIILLVDDEASIRKVVSSMLLSKGYQVIEASSGQEALMKYDSSGELISLLLTDVQMSGMSGIELAKLLLQRQPGLKVLCISGFTNEDPLKAGVHDFLCKPFTSSRLLDKIRRLLGQE